MLIKNPLDDRADNNSIIDTLNQVMIQVEYHCFATPRFRFIDPLYKELCLIISEVFVLKPETLIKVNGDFLLASLVQEIYSQLRNDHLRIVHSNFSGVSSRVYNKKAYLRTALYNVVFEIESHFVNFGEV